MSASSESGFVHRFVPATRAGAPTLLLLHGTGGDENDLIPIGRRLDPDAALLSPRGRVLERGMPRFFRRLAEGVFDLEDLHARTGELANFVAAAALDHGFDPARVVAAGYSNGANIASSLLLSWPGTLAGAVLFRAMVPFEPESQDAGTLARVPVFIGQGRHDPVAPPAGGERLAQILRAAGAEVTLHWTDAGHDLNPADLAAAHEWLLGARLH